MLRGETGFGTPKPETPKKPLQNPVNSLSHPTKLLVEEALETLNSESCYVRFSLGIRVFRGSGFRVLRVECPRLIPP